MFIFTAKINKRKIIAVIFAILLIIGAIVLLISHKSASQVNANEVLLKNNRQRIDFLESLGWEIEDKPIDERKIVIPENFDDVYKEYNNIQKSQGFDLEKYMGEEAVRFTYEIKNYPGESKGIVADIIIHKNKLIAGDVQSVKLDGFMKGLSFPQNETK